MLTHSGNALDARRLRTRSPYQLEFWSDTTGSRHPARPVPVQPDRPSTRAARQASTRPVRPVHVQSGKYTSRQARTSVRQARTSVRQARPGPSVRQARPGPSVRQARAG